MDLKLADPAGASTNALRLSRIGGFDHRPVLRCLRWTSTMHAGPPSGHYSLTMFLKA